MNTLDDQQHQFSKTYNYVFWFTMGVLLYVILITFLPIPKENQRFVDIALAFLLGQLSAIAGYLTGGNPTQSRRSPSAPITTTQASGTLQVDTTTTSNENVS